MSALVRRFTSRCLFLLGPVFLAGLAQANTVPTDGMVITTDTTFVPGTYHLPNGVSIGADGITLNMNGAELVGAFVEGGPTTFGVSCLGYDQVTLKNGVVRGYYYGIRVEDGVGIHVLDNDLDENWVDPDSLSEPAPWLNINVGPNLGDTLNLGGGLYVRDATDAVVSGNRMTDQENGIDLFFVTNSLISGNVASNNTGWGIHLHGSTGNTLSDNTADHCHRPGDGDSAGFLLVMASSDNDVLNNSFQYSGDGFFIGNEHGYPSNDNLVRGNDGSYAFANAFEATFSEGNVFEENVASYSRYGFWLGYSHTGTVVRNNTIHGNANVGIELEHGQHNVIEGNELHLNGGRGIVLRTDGLVHFPPSLFPHLNLPDQAASSFYEIRNNSIRGTFGWAMELISTTDSTIVNNLFDGTFGGTVWSDGSANTWGNPPTPGENIVGGEWLGGNWWSNYTGEDTTGDGIGDTMLPYDNNGAIALPGDPYPLIGDPGDLEIDNPLTGLDLYWFDLGRNRHGDGSAFNTANGAHFATDAVDLYLLEGENSRRLSQLNPATGRYETRADVPEHVWDGGCFQWGGGHYLATVGLSFDSGTGQGKGPKLYSYDPVGDAWYSLPDAHEGAYPLSIEALAWCPTNNRLYATILAFGDGGDPSLIKRLAMFDLSSSTWVGVTSASMTDLWGGSEAEYHDGKIYVWRGGGGGADPRGTDSYLNVYDILSDSWTTTATLADSGVLPGFRSGSFDGWGVGLAADSARGLIFASGGERNHLIYVYEVSSDSWKVFRPAIYDGGWGSSIEFVAAESALYQIDGRNEHGTPQGTGVLRRPETGVGFCFGDPGSGTPCPCGNDNDGSVPGSGCANGVFSSGAQLTGSGTASVTGDTVVLTTTGLHAGNTGLYFQANNAVNGGEGNPFGDGLRCAGGGLIRLQILNADGFGVSSTTISIAALGGVAAGETKRYQCWYRDTSGGQPCGVGVNDFNLSNGYEVPWLP